MYVVSFEQYVMQMLHAAWYMYMDKNNMPIVSHSWWFELISSCAEELTTNLHLVQSPERTGQPPSLCALLTFTMAQSRCCAQRSQGCAQRSQCCVQRSQGCVL